MKNTKRALQNHPTIQKNLGYKLRESEIFYRHLTELTPEAIVVHTKGKIVFVNPSAVELVKATRSEQMIGRSIMDFIHPDSKQIVVSRIKMMLTEKKNAPTVEEKFIAIDGSIVFVEVKAVPFTFNNESAILSIIHDITENKLTHEKLKKNEERREFLKRASDILISSIDYKKTLENIVDIIVPTLADYCRIVVIDEDGNACEVAAKHISPKKLKLVQALYSKYKKKQASHGVDRLLQTGKSELISKLTPELLRKYQTKPEIIRVVEKLELKSYMGIPLKVRGRTIGAITFSSICVERIYTNDDLMFAQEIAHRIALALDNAQLFRNTKNAITLRDDFISIASHELKTPITSLKMYTQVLERQFEKRGDESSMHYLKKINDQIDKLAMLASDLLNASKLQHGKLEIKKDLFDLDEMIADTVEAIQATDRKHRIEIKGSIKQEVYADRYRIYQVLTNLLTNAIKYSPDSDKIILSLRVQHDAVRIMVKDFGIGIDRVHQKRIFNQFYRVADFEEKSYPGLGMGLYISYEIIERHGGRMWVESKKGLGSKFIFTLPIMHV